MRRLLLIALAALALAVPAQANQFAETQAFQVAQALQAIINDTHQSGGAAYSGPGDIVSGASVWWGLRAYSAATTSTNAIDIRRASDAATCTGIKTASNGNLDVATTAFCTGATQTVTAFCNATTCTITKLYDQTGNGRDATQASVPAQPTLSLNCVNTTLPCALFVAGSVTAMSATITAVTAPYTLSCVFNRTGNPGAFNTCVASPGPSAYLGNNTTANTGLVFSGTQLSVAAADNAWHAMQAVVNGASGDINVNGTRTTGNTGSSASTTTFTLGASTFSSTMSWAEAGLWASGLTPTQENNICHNQFAYWATSVSC